MVISSAQAAKQEYDLCVVGTGPAGLPLALEIAKLQPTWRILLLEYGGQNPSENELDDLIVIETPLTHHEPNDCTNKGLGGTSLTWGGRCVLYDEIDFIPRPIVGDECTWDLSVLDSVKPHYAKAGEFLDCGTPIFDTHDMPEVASTRLADGFKEGPVTDSVVERWSMPTRLGGKYRGELREHLTIDLLENARAEVLSVTTGTGTVVSLSVVNRDSGVVFDVKARLFTVAAGAQESTRLLLKSPSVFDRVGGVPSSLGRYYQGHISGKIASIKFSGDPRKTEFGFGRDQSGVYYRRRFQFSTETLLKENLLNTALWLDNPLYNDPKHQNGTMSLIYLAMLVPGIGSKLAPTAIAESITKGTKREVGPHLLNILKGIPKSLYEPATIFVKRYLSGRKLPGVFLYNRNNEYALHFHAEQQPVTQNYMYLDNDGKSLRIYYSYTKEDVDSVIRCHRLLDSWLQETGAGRLNYWYPESEWPARIANHSKDGLHQVGTTRMSLRQRDGVVDPDLRVWGTDNLYICSSSTFPTSGQANPTFLLTAFAVRLAAHLATK